MKHMFCIIAHRLGKHKINNKIINFLINGNHIDVTTFFTVLLGH